MKDSTGMPQSSVFAAIPVDLPYLGGPFYRVEVPSTAQLHAAKGSPQHHLTAQGQAQD